MRNRATTPLAKAKVRMSMNKFNLYNLSRLAPPNYRILNFYQQKWKSKSMLRDYHGEQVREKQWGRIFSRRLRAVAPMDPAYLARNDGSSESAGRGSGLEKEEGVKNPELTPYMLMTFAPLERRLDVAIFRALFASSARQARQFVVHGAVKVNGQVMRYPGYFLHPGDMFQVNPERVMYALGQPKEASQAAEDVEDEEVEAEDEPEVDDEVDIEREPKEVLKDLMNQAKGVLEDDKNIGGKKKRELRAFSKTVRKMLSRSSRETVMTNSLEAQFEEIQNQLKIRTEGKEAKDGVKPAASSEDASTKPEAKNPPPTNLPEGTNFLSATDLEIFYAALRSMQEDADPSDTSSTETTPTISNKPYALPWMPRNFMSAFAFIPRYLEVNQNICAAVYIRHPVARPGSAEVPTPFSESTNSNAFAWYLRRK